MHTTKTIFAIAALLTVPAMQASDKDKTKVTVTTPSQEVEVITPGIAKVDVSTSSAPTKETTKAPQSASKVETPANTKEATKTVTSTVATPSIVTRAKANVGKAYDATKGAVNTVKDTTVAAGKGAYNYTAAQLVKARGTVSNAAVWTKDTAYSAAVKSVAAGLLVWTCADKLDKNPWALKAYQAAVVTALAGGAYYLYTKLTEEKQPETRKPASRVTVSSVR